MKLRRRDERGTSAIELALYMPILMLVILVVIQFALVYLGNAAASAIARAAARTARTTCSVDQAVAAGEAYAAKISSGIFEGSAPQVRIDGDMVTVTIRGQAQKISPIGVPEVTKTVRGPVEHFVGGPAGSNGGCPE